MPTFVQANRPLTVNPKDPSLRDTLLLTSFTGREAVSRLFRFQLDLLADNATAIPFEKLLGQPVTIGLTLADGKTRRFFNGKTRTTRACCCTITSCFSTSRPRM